MQFTDSHIHLQDYKSKSAQQIITDMKKNGFSKVICVSSQSDDWQKVADLAVLYPDFIIPSFGLHPWYISKKNDNWLSEIRQYLHKFPFSCVGECGLDRLKAPTEEGQYDVFVKQLALAKEFNRPINIHALKAEELFNDLWHEMPPKFLLHSFGGSLDFLQKALKHGAYISLSPSVLKRKNAFDIIKSIPSDRLLTESDAPYQSTYEQISEFISALAQIKNISQQQLTSIIYNNFQEFCHVR